MSFGFGVGDFLAVIKLAKNLRKAFVGAPDQFREISDEVRSLAIILEDVEVQLPGHKLSDQEEERLKEISGHCQRVLDDLEKTLDKYSGLEEDKSGLRKGLKRVWKRLKWEPDDIRDFRGRITTNISLLNTFLVGLSSQVTHSIKAGVDRLNEKQEVEENLVILNWLTPIDYSTQQQDFISRRQPGTGQWLLDSNEYRLWTESPGKTLFCPGIPGAGKTILTSIVVDDLTTRFGSDHDVGIGYLYCNFRRRDDQKDLDLLATILKQLCWGLPTLPSEMRTLYDKHMHSKLRPSIDELRSTLHQVVTKYSRVFVIVDAVDEYQFSSDSREHFLSNIFNSQEKTGLNFFATSRLIPEIMNKFEGCLQLEIRASDDDVEQYLDGHMFQLPNFVAKNADLQHQIKTALIQSVDGMFLLAKLHFDSLIGKKSPKTMRLALERLSTGSDAYHRAYDEAMARIEGQLPDQAQLAKQVLAWIVCARRPLKTIELQHALAVEEDDPELDEENISEVEDMLSVCAGLVTVDEQSGIVRLVHFTTQEYFEKTQQQWFPNAQADITSVCLTYLLFDVFGDGECETEEEFAKRWASNPLYKYAADSWGFHARGAYNLAEQLPVFLSSPQKVMASAQTKMVQKDRYRYLLSTPRKVTCLHLVADFGLVDSITTAHSILGVVDPRDARGRTPLHYAAWNGHDIAAQLLLQKGADVNSEIYITGHHYIMWLEMAKI